MLGTRWAIGCLVLALATGACGRAQESASPPGPSVAPTAEPSLTYAPVALTVNTLQAPATGQAGVPITVVVGVVLPNGCTSFDRLELDTDDANAQVTVSAIGLQAQNVFCTQNLTYRSISTTFTPARVGLYQLRAAKGEGTATIDVR